LFIFRLQLESLAKSRLAQEFFKDFCCYMLGMNNPAPAGAGWGSHAGAYAQTLSTNLGKL
jgi:hypothetical protein